MITNKLYLIVGLLFGCISFVSAQQRTSMLLTNTVPSHEAVILPTKYKVIEEEIEIAPALNGDMDTSNYFMMAEMIEVRPAVQDWCMINGNYVRVDIPAEYITIERKFFPFKNILDTERAIHIIPAETITIKRTIVEEPSTIRLIRFGDEDITTKHKTALESIRTETSN